MSFEALDPGHMNFVFAPDASGRPKPNVLGNVLAAAEADTLQSADECGSIVGMDASEEWLAGHCCRVDTEG